jgi:STE24 endopeptidase
VIDKHGNDKRTERYFKVSTRLGYLTALFIGFCFGISYVAWKLHPFFGFFVSILLATAVFLILVLFGYRVDRKYKEITGSRKDYLIAALPLYAIMLSLMTLPLFFLNILFQATGMMIFVYFNVFVVLLFLVSSILGPRVLRFRSRGLKLENPMLVEKLLSLAEKMDVNVEKIMVLPWKKLKVANALQVGPRKCSIYISDYLIENLPLDEVEAVVAHELAHAKKRHLLKSLLLTLPFVLVGTNLMLYYGMSYANNPRSLEAAAGFFVGMAFVLAVNFVTMPLRRRFELEADALAADVLGSPETMISALQKISELNLIPKRYPLIIGWGLSHPSLEIRIRKLRRLEGEYRE